MLQHHLHSHLLEAGTDEAGRGPLAGSVFAAAVILPPLHFTAEEAATVTWDTPFPEHDYRWMALLNDSKQLTEQQRLLLRHYIQRDAIAWAVAEVTPQEIDQHNILNASILCMHRALARLTPQPQHILVDGNRFKPYGMPAVPYQTVVKGDGRYMAIAAASILAKTARDEYMLHLHTLYPQYSWDKNKGYPTKQHRRAVLQYGLTPVHRKTFTFKTTDL